MAKSKVLLQNARECGLRIGLIQSPNQGYGNAPKKLRGVKVPGNLRGNHGINLCAGKPDARKLLLKLYAEILDEFTGLGLDFFTLWPYDEGGCACRQCWPWGACGYVDISKELAERVRAKFPHCKIILSTWCFENENDHNPDGEWAGLAKALDKDKSWVDYLMADGHDDYFPAYPLKAGSLANLPLLNFPEISMFGMNPWGGYGANPSPNHFQTLWDRIKHRISGGAPYSEGIYEDLNKAVWAGFYWDPERKAEDTVREYIAFEFSPHLLDELQEVVRTFEKHHHRNGIGKKALAVFELVTRAEESLSDYTRKSWRWRVFFLRARIDAELFKQSGELQGTILKDAFEELAKIYHAGYALSRQIRPPLIE